MGATRVAVFASWTSELLMMWIPKNGSRSGCNFYLYMCTSIYVSAAAGAKYNNLLYYYGNFSHIFWKFELRDGKENFSVIFHKMVTSFFVMCKILELFNSEKLWLFGMIWETKIGFIQVLSSVESLICSNANVITFWTTQCVKFNFIILDIVQVIFTLTLVASIFYPLHN